MSGSLPKSKDQITPSEQDGAVLKIAAREALRTRKFRDAEDEATDRQDNGRPNVPLLHVTRTGWGSGAGWKVTSSGEEGHPNEPRMSFLRDWIGDTVLDSSLQGDVGGTYRIELHDSFSYLPRAHEYRDVLSFGRGMSSTAQVALFPDPYQASAFGGMHGMLGPKDTRSWSSKRPTIIFAGSSTGDVEADKNARIRACIWAMKHRDVTDFRITALVQMGPHDACMRVPLLQHVIAPHVPVETHFNHRFIANIVGNTACWSRVPMVLRSNSLLFHLCHDDVTWYQTELHKGEHYIECNSHEELLVQRLKCQANEEGCIHMAAQANKFYSRFLTVNAAATYARELLYNIAGK